jgi:hypothetical protein
MTIIMHYGTRLHVVSRQQYRISKETSQVPYSVSLL